MRTWKVQWGCRRKIAMAVALAVCSTSTALAVPTIHSVTVTVYYGYAFISGYVSDSAEDPTGSSVEMWGDIEGTTTVNSAGRFDLVGTFIGPEAEVILQSISNTGVESDEVPLDITE